MNLQPSCWLTGRLFSTDLSNIFSYIWLWFTLVPYLAKGHRRDINNGPGVTQIVPTFWHNIYSNWTGIMAPSQTIPILGQMEDTPVQVSYLWIPGGCHICPRAAGLTSIMAREVTRIVAPFSPGVYLIPTRIMASPQATPILCQMKSIYLFKSPIYDFLVATMSSILT